MRVSANLLLHHFFYRLHVVVVRNFTWEGKPAWLQTILCFDDYIGWEPEVQRVAVLVDGVQMEGTHSVRWRGVDDRNQPVPSGLYTHRLSAGSMTCSKKMVFVR